MIQDVLTLRTLIIITMFQDIAFFNRNYKYKRMNKKNTGCGVIYNKDYWKELQEDLHSDWFKYFCHTFSLSHKKVIEYLLTNKFVSYVSNMESTSIDFSRFGYKRIRRWTKSRDCLPRWFTKNMKRNTPTGDANARLDG